MTRRPVAAVVVAIAALAGALVGCGDDNGGTDASGLPADLVDLRGQAEGGQYPEVSVSAKDNIFEPAGIQIDPGVTVNWTNDGRSPHNITPVDAEQAGLESFGADTDAFDAGDKYEFRFDAPGTYRYYCTLHGTATEGMTGVVVVGEGTAGGEVAGGDDAGGLSGTIHVPADVPTIQEAVDRAEPGALVLVAPGVYEEAVTVTSPGIVIRGEDRDRTILDGGFSDEPGHENGFKVLADGVAIENMTAQNFASNGFFWTGVTGFRGSYLTALRNGDYGIYSFDSTNGQFDHDYGAGSPDAGFYVGQCYPCHVVLSDDEAEWNGIGYSGTNAGGDLVIVRSSFHDNRAGVVPNSGTGEANPPERETTIVGNHVFANNNTATAALEIARTATGNGILLAGGNDNVVERNLVENHDISGIAAVPLPEKVLDPENAEAQNFDATGNRIVGNVVRDSRAAADIVIVATIDGDTDPMGNCASDNTFTTSIPDGVEQLVPCGQPASPAYKTDPGRFLSLIGAEKPAGADYKTVPLPDPPALPDMPDALDAPARPATGPPAAIDLTAISVP